MCHKTGNRYIFIKENTMCINTSSIYIGNIQRQNSPFREILHLGEKHIFKKNSSVFMDKNFDHIFFYIDTGCVTLYHDMPNGKSVYIGKFYEGNTFATSVAVVSDFTNYRTYNIHYTFDEETVAWSFPVKIITDREMIIKYPDIISYVLQQQCLKTLIMHNNFTMRNEERAEKMLCNFIINLSLDHGSSTILSPNISQTTLANSLGIHRTTLARVLKKLREKKILGSFTSSKLEILDMDKLMCFAKSLD